MVWRYRVTVPLAQIEFDLVAGGMPMEVLRLTFQQYEALRVRENIALQFPSFSLTYYPIENLSSAIFHCVPLLENKYRKIDLRPQKQRILKLSRTRISTYGTILIFSGANSQTCTTCKHKCNHTHKFHLSRHLAGWQLSRSQRSTPWLQQR